MFYQTVGKKIIQRDSLVIDEGYSRVVADVGCGDGKEIYAIAYDHPEFFCVGIDPNFKALEHISRKASRKPAKGGLPNILFIQSALEILPASLHDLADEVRVTFPWGSLLQGIITVDTEFYVPLRNLAKDGARLEIITTYADKFESKYREERELPELSLKYLSTTFKAKVLEFGIKVTQIESLEEEDKLTVQSSWGKKLLSTRGREVYRIIGRVFK